MRLHIHHETTYRYAHPVALQPHRLLVTPRGDHEMTLVSRTLDCTPTADIAWSQDVFGNLIATASFAGSTDRLAIVSDVVVEQDAAAWPVFRVAPDAHAYPFAYPPADVVDLGAFLVPSHADPDGRIASWAQRSVLGPTTDTLSLLKDINADISAQVAYRTRDEEGTQTPAETLDMASGSCRDIAALFIDAVRHLGFGARAVTGYLHDPDARPDDSGSTHAWAEVYLPGAGWIAFDPTHRRVGSAFLVPVAAGRHNGQIMPVTGGYVGAAGDALAMDVRVSVRAG